MKNALGGRHSCEGVNIRLDRSDMLAKLQSWQLHFAAQRGDLARVESLLQKKYPPNRFDELGKTPLHYAVDAGHLEIVDLLLRAGANVNAYASYCTSLAA